MSDLTIGQLESAWSGLKRPKNGQVFQHYKGGKYEIVATGFIEGNQEPCVVYRSITEGVVWVRPAKDFFEKITFNGEEQSRFKLLTSTES